MLQPWDGAGAVRVVELLLERGADAGAVCERGANALHHAAELGRAPVLARLLAAPSGPGLVRCQDALGWAPLHYAARHVEPACAAVLLQARSCLAQGPWHAESSAVRL